MNKRNIIIAVVILVLLVSVGIIEIVIINTNFDKFHEQLETAKEGTLAETLTLEEFNTVWDFWDEHRTLLEFFLTHNETIELEMRLAECYAYLENDDYEGLNVQLTVLIELSEHIPHKCSPKPEHIL